MGKGKGKNKSCSQGPSPQEDPRTLTEKAFDPAFTPSKVLGSNASPTSPQAITKWMAKLRLTDNPKSQLQQSCQVAAATLKCCTEEEEVDILHQRAADFGFPVRHLKEAKGPEIFKIVLAASALAS